MERTLKVQCSEMRKSEKEDCIIIVKVAFSVPSFCYIIYPSLRCKKSPSRPIVLTKRLILCSEGCVRLGSLFDVLVVLKPQHKNVSCTSLRIESGTRFHPSSANSCCCSEFTAKQELAIENCMRKKIVFKNISNNNALST
uniref:Uncharacterized protein n=1 Tax=Glossina brevipalpis TaxID=37001 RepID=A0A1A9X3Z2_9MUSC